MLLASDANNKEFENPKNPDAALQVLFYQRTEPHNFNMTVNTEHKLCDGECSHTAYLKGKTFPLPEEVTEDWVRISIPGRADLTIEEPIREDHRKRFPRQWEKYITSGSDQSSGIKLQDWQEGGKPVLSAHHVETLNAQRFYTVDQIASCSDGQLQALGMNANMLRTKARAFILGSRTDPKAQELEELKASIPDLIAKATALAVQAAMSQAQLPAAKKKPGRPPKVKADGANATPTSQPSAG